MSLAEVMKDLASEMEKTANDLECGNADRDDSYLMIRGYVMTIRMAVKMSESIKPQPTTQIQLPTGPDTRWIEKRAYKELSELKTLSDFEENAPSMATAEDGPEEGISVLVPPGTQIGGDVRIGPYIYTLASPNTLKCKGNV